MCCLISRSKTGVWSGRTWFANNPGYIQAVPKHAISKYGTIGILWYGYGYGTYLSALNIYYRTYNPSTGVWTPIISATPTLLTNLNRYEFHCATFVNKFSFSSSGHDVAWCDAANSGVPAPTIIKFWGDAKYCTKNAPSFVPFIVFENGMANK